MSGNWSANSSGSGSVSLWDTGHHTTETNWRGWQGNVSVSNWQPGCAPCVSGGSGETSNCPSCSWKSNKTQPVAFKPSFLFSGAGQLYTFLFPDGSSMETGTRLLSSFGSGTEVVIWSSMMGTPVNAMARAFLCWEEDPTSLMNPKEGFFYIHAVELLTGGTWSSFCPPFGSAMMGIPTMTSVPSEQTPFGQAQCSQCTFEIHGAANYSSPTRLTSFCKNYPSLYSTQISNLIFSASQLG